MLQFVSTYLNRIAYFDNFNFTLWPSHIMFIVLIFTQPSEITVNNLLRARKKLSMGGGRREYLPI